MIPSAVSRLCSLRVGGHKRSELRDALLASGMGLNEHAETLLAHDAIETPAITLQLVTATPASLGLVDGGTLPDIYAAARAAGLRVCPLATAPYLRLVHREEESTDAVMRRYKPPDRALHVASASVSPDSATPKGFYLRTVAGTRWLRGYRCDDDYLVPPTTTYVFDAPIRT